MTAVYFFSGSGHSRAVAEYIAREFNTELIEITDLTPAPAENIETAVIVFPVYCQNIPAPIIPFLKNISTPKVALIATYGGISHGNGNGSPVWLSASGRQIGTDRRAFCGRLSGDGGA